MLQKLDLAIGRECTLDDVNRKLRGIAQGYRAPVVGAMHITCADESEWECIDSFQKRIVDKLLPALKLTRRACFHISNLGARYEDGALAVAEHHYATPETRSAFKVMLVKLNSHVAADGTGSDMRFGQMQRYESKSTACGALHALLDGKSLPALRSLSELFHTDGHDRLTTLLDPTAVAKSYRSLFVAIACARLQARRVELAALTDEPHSPTVYVIAPAVTLNRADEDTELLVGLGIVDRRGAGQKSYQGLGDDPAKYKVRFGFDDRLEVYED